MDPKLIQPLGQPIMILHFLSLFLTAYRCRALRTPCEDYTIKCQKKKHSATASRCAEIGMREYMKGIHEEHRHLLSNDLRHGRHPWNMKPIVDEVGGTSPDGMLVAVHTAYKT